MNASCDWIKTNLQAHLDGELTAEERARVERHLQTCARCRELLATARSADELVRDAAMVLGDAEEREANARLATFRARFDLGAAERLRRREMLTDAGGEPMSAEGVASAPLEDGLRRAAPPRRRGLFAPRPVWRWVSIGSAAAAVAVVAVVLLVREPDLPHRGLVTSAPAEAVSRAPAPVASPALAPAETDAPAPAEPAGEKKAGTQDAEVDPMVPDEIAKRERRMQALEPPAAAVEKERAVLLAEEGAFEIADKVETEEAMEDVTVEAPADGPIADADLLSLGEVPDEPAPASSRRDSPSWGGVTKMYRGGEGVAAIEVQDAPTEQKIWSTLLSFLQEPFFDLSGASFDDRVAMLELAEDKLRSEDVSPRAVWVALGDAWFAVWEGKRAAARHGADEQQDTESAPLSGQRAHAAYLEAMAAGDGEPLTPEERQRVQRQIELLEAYRYQGD
jgi:anti-sigma factor RsiW